MVTVTKEDNTASREVEEVSTGQSEESVGFS